MCKAYFELFCSLFCEVWLHIFYPYCRCVSSVGPINYKAVVLFCTVKIGQWLKTLYISQGQEFMIFMRNLLIIVGLDHICQVGSLWMMWVSANLNGFSEAIII